jgi:predicted  nucleic acid-binding Zn-ribbon protein
MDISAPQSTKKKKIWSDTTPKKTPRTTTGKLAAIECKVDTGNERLARALAHLDELTEQVAMLETRIDRLNRQTDGAEDLAGRNSAALNTKMCNLRDGMDYLNSAMVI